MWPPRKSGRVGRVSRRTASVRSLRRRIWLATLALIVAFSVGHSTVGRSDTDASLALARRVAALRLEVDRLAGKLRDQRKSTRTQLDALRGERADLERRVRLERVRAKALVQLGTKRREQAAKLEAEIAKWLTPVRDSVAHVRRYVARTLPFKRSARAAAVERIAADLSTSHPDPASVLTRLWRFVEEEAALARDVGLSQQVLPFEGRRVMVDVARVGMGLLFVRAPGGAYAWAVRKKGGWTIVRLHQQAAVDRVRQLFNLLEQNRAYGRAALLLPKSPPTVRSNNAKGSR